MLVWPQVMLFYLNRKFIVNISESGVKGTFPLGAGFCFTSEIQAHNGKLLTIIQLYSS